MMKILHLSDLHFGIQKSTSAEYHNHRQEVLESFFRDFGQIVENNWAPDVIVISGDLGWCGQLDDYLGKEDVSIYKTFEQFLEKLIEVSGVSPDHVICCPGNHDKKIPKECQKGTFREINSIDEEAIKKLSPYFADYSEAMRRLGLKPLINEYTQSENSGSSKSVLEPPNKLRIAANKAKHRLPFLFRPKNDKEDSIPNVEYLYGYREIEGICFVVLNSAWLCDYREEASTDYGNLLGRKLFHEISEKYVREKSGNKPFSHAFLYHHPDNWFSETENYPVADNDRRLLDTMRLFSETGPITFNGHVHNPSELSGRDSLIFSAGTLSSSDTYRYISSQCWLFEICLNEENPVLSKIRKGRYFTYLDHGTGFLHWKFEIESDRYYSANAVENVIKEDQIAWLKRMCEQDGLLKMAIESLFGSVDDLLGLDSVILNRIILWLAEQTYDKVEVIVENLGDIINDGQKTRSQDMTLRKRR